MTGLFRQEYKNLYVAMSANIITNRNTVLPMEIAHIVQHGDKSAQTIFAQKVDGKILN